MNWKQVEAFIISCVMVAALVLLILLLQSCTAVTYQDKDGRRLYAFDLRLAGSAVDIQIVRPDGTRVIVARDQESPEDTVTAIGEAVNPVRFP